MRFAAGNAQHIGARSQQQDAFGFSDPNDLAFTEHAGLLGVVADGIGGMALGFEASRAAVHSFLRAYQGKAASESIAEALNRSVVAANDAVCSLSGGRSSESQAGTTLVAAVLRGDELHWIAAGDSRLYLLRQRCLTRVTMDHVYARRLDQRVGNGTMTRAEALRHPDRTSLTSYVGMADVPVVDRSVRPVRLQSGDRVILCTDGLYRALSEAELTAALGRDLNGACAALTRLAIKKGRAQQDNLTVIALSHEPDRNKYWSTRRRRWARAAVVAAAAACLSIVVVGGTAYWQRHLLGDQQAGAKGTNGGRPSPAHPAEAATGKDKRTTKSPATQPPPASTPAKPKATSPGPPSIGVDQPAVSPTTTPDSRPPRIWLRMKRFLTAIFGGVIGVGLSTRLT